MDAKDDQRPQHEPVDDDHPESVKAEDDQGEGRVKGRWKGRRGCGDYKVLS